MISFSISCFMGKQRSGKTLSMVAQTYNIYFYIKNYIAEIDLKIKQKRKVTELEMKRYDLFKKYTILSNLTLNREIFGDYEQIKSKDLVTWYKDGRSISNKIIALDDFFKDIDSRDFGKNSNKIFSYFITEIGKKENILLYVSHFDTMVEKRLRGMTEHFILCRKGKFIKLRKGDKLLDTHIWKEEDDYYKLSLEPENIVIQQNFLGSYIDFSSEIIAKKYLDKIEYLKAKKYFDMYNTKEIV